MRRRYEIHDEQWEIIKGVLPAERKKQGGRPAKDNRTMLNAMLWIARTGAPWRDLPEYYGSWKSVYTRFRRWQMAGVWDQILEHVSIEPDFENVMIDATVVRVHQHGAGAKGGSNFQAIGRSRGGLTTKIHAIVDALGNPLRFELTGGQSHDCVTGYEMLMSMELAGTNVLADRGYDTNAILNLLQDQHANPVIPSKKSRRFQRHCDRWLYKERHGVECFFNKIKHYRRIATRFEKLACTFKAFLTLVSIMIWMA
ncbi:IS5 family transposase [Paenibacillus elgii]|uniref:IS5 family transposase n=1 Tax=Paenibacillus elgii TaxID=189691 RepID=UPI000FD6E820|nr:IS5 family transposase [Paenibacillus elgii]NEN82437.1 IS5 family transposase [Paenibacillus elgii]